MTTDASDRFVKGQRIDRYEIREHIGQGGMGTVYRAVDAKLGRTVALKTVVAHRRGDKLTEELRQRFMREALAASRVDHRNVVQVLDFGFADDGTPYMVMEYLRGQSLSAVLKKAREPLAIDYVADVLLSVCAALRACHHVGIVHRDLKPANIFLCDTDTGWEVKVLDFGISKAPAADELTQGGQIIGTPQYLSPEQIDGTVRPESDQYALGVLLYACLTQHLPFEGHQGVRLLRAISEGAFDPPRTLRPDLPEGLQAIVLRAMHLRPSERFESIHALGQRLWEFASPRGQAQWKTFYFHTPAAQPLNVTAAPLGTPATSPSAPSVSSSLASAPSSSGYGQKLDSTASLERVSPPAKTDPQASTIGPSGFAITRTAAAAGVAEATGGSHSDIAGESALSDADGANVPAGRTRVRSVARWWVAVALAGVVGLAVVIQRAAQTSRPAVPAPARGGATAPAPPVVDIAPRAPAPPPPPAAPAPPAPVTVGSSPPAVSPAGPAAGVGSPPEPAKRKHATRRHRTPKTDQHGIGIPSE